MSVVAVRLAGVPRRVRIASVNVNGIRAATRKGMIEWLDAADVDVLALQEVRATLDEVQAVLPGWEIVNDEALAKGRAGVAVATRMPAVEVRRVLGPEPLDSAGRWIEADFDIDGERLTVVSAYVHTGEADGLEWTEWSTRYGAFDMEAEPDRVFAPDGESWNGFHERIGQMLDRIAREYVGQTVVAVCHAGVIMASMRVLLGIPKSAIGAQIRPTNTGLTEWEHDPERARWTLHAFNETAHLLAPALHPATRGA